METKPKTTLDENGNALEIKQVPPCSIAAFIHWVEKLPEFDSGKATQAYLEDPFARPLGH